MKIKYLKIVLFSFIIFVSCADPGGDEGSVGFTFLFTNYTSSEYSEAKLIIGGMKNGSFVPTDSINISPKIKLNGNINYYFVGENRWKPDFNKIRNLPSDRCYFMMKLTRNRRELIKGDGQSLLNFLIQNSSSIKGEQGIIHIGIWDNKIEGG